MNRKMAREMNERVRGGKKDKVNDGGRNEEGRKKEFNKRNEERRTEKFFSRNDECYCRRVLYWLLLLLTDLPRAVLEPQGPFLKDHFKHFNHHSCHNNHTAICRDNYAQYLPLGLLGRVKCPIDANPADYVVLWFKNGLPIKTTNNPRVKVADAVVVAVFVVCCCCCCLLLLLLFVVVLFSSMLLLFVVVVIITNFFVTSVNFCAIVVSLVVIFR